VQLSAKHTRPTERTMRFIPMIIGFILGVIVVMGLLSNGTRIK
jgi:uncharacterized membrane protein YoaK (UPF0700 family)